ncbi:MAG: Gfo/Idh/MocA family oxidoreductase [Planctomycetia bacterium]|nr:Gfo/Idh/MocA family oxidoreductase [Planctomycetia bacterium]
MNQRNVSRRRFLKTTAGGTLGAAAAAATVPYIFTGATAAQADESKAAEKNDRLHFGQIGCGGQGNGDTNRAMPYGDLLAVADVDAGRGAFAKNHQGKGKADLYEDYRKVLDRKDIDAVVIGTPDHWHTKIAIEAMQAGKDVYCEKPLTLTVDEGKQILKVLKSTGKVFQVGTQQRSEGPFGAATAICREGKLGKIKRITVAIGGAPTSNPLKKVPVPNGLNWDMWLGQAPMVDYISGPNPHGRTPESRCLYEFRWWLEYSGGKLTDWGAHHVDIAQWMLGAEDTGPVSFEGTGTFPVPYKAGYPTVDNQYNTATKFHITAKFADGAELVIVDAHPRFDNGVFVEGDKDHLFVSRSKMSDEPDGKSNSWTKGMPSEEAIAKVRKGHKSSNGGGAHMRNFVECIKSRALPISDAYSHHRAISTCHLANICIRLGRPIKWDPAAEQIIGDEEASTFLKRPQRKGYEIVV